jgi:flagellar hook-length control protein FliK
MIHNDIQNQLALLVKTSVSQLIDVADSPLEAPKWTPGQQLPAQVIANLPSGRFQVQVENQILDMNLPRNTQPGEEIQLTYITSSPRMTFALTPELEAKLPPQVANSGVTLSDTARFLGALLQKNSSADASGTASASGTIYRPVGNQVATAELAKTAVVVPGEPPPTREFAQALRTAVSQSGLFYESHQAQWVTGERTLASILQEPQARFPALNPQPLPAQANAALLSNPSTFMQPSASTTGLPTANPNLPASAVLQTQAQDVAATNNFVGGAQAIQTRLGVAAEHGAERDFSVSLQHGVDTQGGLTARDPVHPMAQPIVQQQLDTLETRQIVWQGQVWPGQQMDWQINEDGSHGAQDGENAPRWRTQLHLDMPALGGVTAKLMMDGNGVRVDFSADRSKTAERMRSDIGSLAQAMQDAGLKVSGLKVNRDGTA